MNLYVAELILRSVYYSVLILAGVGNKWWQFVVHYYYKNSVK